MKVKLTQTIFGPEHDGSGYLHRYVELPIQPFVGLRIVLPTDEEFEVETVYVDLANDGVIVCRGPRDRARHEKSWQQTLIAGLVKMGWVEGSGE